MWNNRSNNYEIFGWSFTVIVMVVKFTGRLTWEELKIFHALLLHRTQESADAMLPPVLLTGKYINPKK